MKKYGVRLICAASIAAVVLSSMSVPSFATSIEEEEQKQKQMEQDLADSQGILEQLQEFKANTDTYIQALDEKLNELTADILELQKQQEDKQAEIDETQKQLDKQEADIAEQYATMKKRIQFMFENGNTFYMDMLFDTDNISDLLNKAEYISELEQYDRDMLNKMQDTQEQIQESKDALVAEKSELDQLEYKTQAEQDSVAALIADKQTELDNYNLQISDTEEKIRKQQEELEAEQELVNQMKIIEAQRAAAAAAAAAAGNGGSYSPVMVASGFMWPLANNYTITSEYGTRTDPINGSTSYHSGIDIGAPSGTPIMAVADGQVAWSYYSTTAGNWIGIDHGGDVYSVYMHCSASYVTAGQKVSKGDVIGLVGSTGRSTGPHLHLSIRANGEYVNPHSFVG